MFIHFNLRQPVVSASVKHAPTRQTPTFQGNNDVFDSDSEDIAEFTFPPTRQLKMLDTQNEIREKLAEDYRKERARHPESNPEIAYLSESDTSVGQASTSAKKALLKIAKSKTKSERNGKNRRLSLTASERGPDLVSQYLTRIDPIRSLIPWLKQTQGTTNGAEQHAIPTDAQKFSEANDSLTYQDDEHESLPGEFRHKKPDPLNLFNLEKHSLQALRH